MKWSDGDRTEKRRDSIVVDVADDVTTTVRTVRDMMKGTTRRMKVAEIRFNQVLWWEDLDTGERGEEAADGSVRRFWPWTVGKTWRDGDTAFSIVSFEPLAIGGFTGLTARIGQTYQDGSQGTSWNDVKYGLEVLYTKSGKLSGYDVTFDGRHEVTSWTLP